MVITVTPVIKIVIIKTLKINLVRRINLVRIGALINASVIRLIANLTPNTIS